MPPFRDPTTTPTTVFPKMDVTPGVLKVVSGPYRPLFSIRGIGSQTSPPLDIETTEISGGVNNSGAVKVWIVPVGQRPDETTIPYYTNNAGDGGAIATLPRRGTYVVVVEAANPEIQWTVDIADSTSVNLGTSPAP